MLSLQDEDWDVEDKEWVPPGHQLGSMAEMWWEQHCQGRHSGPPVFSYGLVISKESALSLVCPPTPELACPLLLLVPLLHLMASAALYGPQRTQQTLLSFLHFNNFQLKLPLPLALFSHHFQDQKIQRGKLMPSAHSLFFINIYVCVCGACGYMSVHMHMCGGTHMCEYTG